MIPKDLIKYPNWVNWQFKDVNGRKTKCPINPNTGKMAKSNDSTTWSTFAKAFSNSFSFDGVGFVFSENDPFVGIDIDHCIRKENGIIEPYAEEIIRECNSYTEISPSGTGIHIIGIGNLQNSSGKRCAKIEMYTKQRFFTVTGKVYGEYKKVNNIQHVIEKIEKKYFQNRNTIKKEVSQEQLEFSHEAPTEDDMIFLENILFKQKNGDVLQKIYEGENPLYEGDRSRNDLYFCNQICWANGNDLAMADRIFRSSARMRDKWDKKHFQSGNTYGQETLRKAYSASPKRKSRLSGIHRGERRELGR